MNSKEFKNIVNTSMSIANLLRGGWKSYEYQDVVLPFLVLKRLDTVLEPTKSKVIGMYNDLEGKKVSLNILKDKTGYDFYNISSYTFKKLLNDPNNITVNLENYIEGFSDNIKDIFDKLNFTSILERLAQGDLLYRIITEFDKLDLHPENISNHEIGLAFEDLIRQFAEQSNETAGEHYTPRDVVYLMASLLFAGEEETLKKAGTIVRLYDPACGTGGMLTVGKEYIREYINKKADVFLYGQELNPKTYAIAKADMLMKGENPDLIKGGEKEHRLASSLSNDQHSKEKFDYIISNPPYGVEWKNDEKAVKDEAERGRAGRFHAGLPAISDGQLLFLQHAISKFQPISEGGSDAVIITNGSPLFTGDAGSGPSEIRRWMFENDYIETIIALPESLFFNTGIPTYIWIFSNRKSDEMKDKIQLIDSRGCKKQLRKNLGNKRYEISEEDAKEILNLYKNNTKNGRSKIVETKKFGYRAVTIQQPLRLNFQVSEERLEKLLAHIKFIGPVIDEDEKEAVKIKKMKAKEVAIVEKEKLEKNVLPVLKKMDDKLYKNRDEFLKVFDGAFEGVAIDNPVRKIIIDSLSERDETADICKKKNGEIEADKELKDIERIPLGQDIYEYFEKEVKPYVPDAWIDESVKDKKDGEIGKIGYEVPFTRYFYKYTPPRAVEEIEGEIKELEGEIQKILREI
jgi:type I restriction enzyme M protein